MIVAAIPAVLPFAAAARRAVARVTPARRAGRCRGTAALAAALAAAFAVRAATQCGACVVQYCPPERRGADIQAGAELPTLHTPHAQTSVHDSEMRAVRSLVLHG